MKLPKMNGLDVLGLIGTGESGRVFGARDDEGKIWAVKVFEGMAINRGLLSRMTLRLEAGGWPEGVLQIESADLDGRPACWVLPLFAETEGEGEEMRWQVRSLQHQIDQHPGENTWDIVKQIGTALAGMHGRLVAHGNLKPGNVFFDEEGKVYLGDWTLGNMPGITHFDFTDALLYQSPEQLVDPGGYFEEAGYRWDVFAFGVLAYRLLTGTFPRCDKMFSAVAPAEGETTKKGIHADSARVAQNLLGQPETNWPSNPSNDLEAGYRSWIDQCLALDPTERPGSLMTVMAGFAEVERKVEAAQAQEKLLDQRRRSERFGRRAVFYSGMATAGCLVLGGLWYLTHSQLEKERGERVAERIGLERSANEAIAQRKTAETAKEAAEKEMEYERELGLARLESSRLIGDRLFDWAMEKGNRSLPTLDGRELRLKRLERFFEDFLRRTAEIKSLDDERARVRMQLAEVSLAAGDAKKSEERLALAIDGWVGAMDGEMKMRIGRNALLLALLKQVDGDPEVEKAFVVARTALADVPQAEVDSQRLQQLVAIMDFHEAKLLAANGEDGKALQQLMGATKKLNELADARPDAAVLRSELAACYLSSATILEGMGKLGDAREVRALAAEELIALLRIHPEDIQVRLELAGCYGAMAEASVLAGDVGAADAASAEAMKLLDAILKERPDSTVAATRKAAQLGLQAGLLRDQGKQEEAMKAFQDGINLLERQRPRGDVMVDYRLALLWWQKGRMLGFAGEKDRELSFLAKSRDLLRELESIAERKVLSDEDLLRSSAYLLGDYAHALELAKKTDKAKELYGEAVMVWERLLKSRPQSEEYREGLEWIRQRAKEI